MKLNLFEKYTRREVHDIFDPFSNFEPRRGTWGLQGIVNIPGRSNDYVFFVTFGHKEGDFAFQEGINNEGILTWQSQPKQKLTDRRIKQFISHNHLVNNIYLFLRTNKINSQTKKSEPYTYLGRLAYIGHDPNHEQPVHFQWQLLDWDTEGVKKYTNLNIISNNTEQEEKFNSNVNTLTFTEPPEISPKKGNSSTNFYSKQIDFAQENIRNHSLGLAGEELVVLWEKKHLCEIGRNDLAKKVFHTSKIEGDGAGYDILSWTLDGQRKYIEVKTTKGGAKTPYYMSINEINFSQVNSNKYYLYRLYEFNTERNSAKSYVVYGNISEMRTLTPTQYKVL